MHQKPDKKPGNKSEEPCPVCLKYHTQCQIDPVQQKPRKSDNSSQKCCKGKCQKSPEKEQCISPRVNSLISKIQANIPTKCPPYVDPVQEVSGKSKENPVLNYWQGNFSKSPERTQYISSFVCNIKQAPTVPSKCPQCIKSSRKDDDYCLIKPKDACNDAKESFATKLRKISEQIATSQLPCKDVPQQPFRKSEDRTRVGSAKPTDQTPNVSNRNVYSSVKPQTPNVSNRNVSSSVKPTDQTPNIYNRNLGPSVKPIDKTPNGSNKNLAQGANKNLHRTPSRLISPNTSEHNAVKKTTSPVKNKALQRTTNKRGASPVKNKGTQHVTNKKATSPVRNKKASNENLGSGQNASKSGLTKKPSPQSGTKKKEPSKDVKSPTNSKNVAQEDKKKIVQKQQPKKKGDKKDNAVVPLEQSTNEKQCECISDESLDVFIQDLAMAEYKKEEECLCVTDFENPEVPNDEKSPEIVMKNSGVNQDKEEMIPMQQEDDKKDSSVLSFKQSTGPIQSFDKDEDQKQLEDNENKIEDNLMKPLEQSDKDECLCGIEEEDTSVEPAQQKATQEKCCCVSNLEIPKVNSAKDEVENNPENSSDDDEASLQQQSKGLKRLQSKNVIVDDNIQDISSSQPESKLVSEEDTEFSSNQTDEDNEDIALSQPEGKIISEDTEVFPQESPRVSFQKSCTAQDKCVNQNQNQSRSDKAVAQQSTDIMFDKGDVDNQEIMSMVEPPFQDSFDEDLEFISLDSSEDDSKIPIAFGSSSSEETQKSLSEVSQNDDTTENTSMHQADENEEVSKTPRNLEADSEATKAPQDVKEKTFVNPKSDSDAEESKAQDVKGKKCMCKTSKAFPLRQSTSELLKQISEDKQKVISLLEPLLQRTSAELRKAPDQNAASGDREVEEPPSKYIESDFAKKYHYLAMDAATSTTSCQEEPQEELSEEEESDEEPRDAPTSRESSLSSLEHTPREAHLFNARATDHDDLDTLSVASSVNGPSPTDTVQRLKIDIDEGRRPSDVRDSQDRGRPEKEMRSVQPEAFSVDDAQSTSSAPHKVQYNMDQDKAKPEDRDRNIMAKLQDAPDTESISARENEIAAIQEKMREIRNIPDEDSEEQRRFQISSPDQFEIRRLSTLPATSQDNDEEQVESTCCGFRKVKKKTPKSVHSLDD